MPTRPSETPYVVEREVAIFTEADPKPTYISGGFWQSGAEPFGPISSSTHRFETAEEAWVALEAERASGDFRVVREGFAHNVR